MFRFFDRLPNTPQSALALPHAPKALRVSRFGRLRLGRPGFGRPSTTLISPTSQRPEVCPPTLRAAPVVGNGWQRFLFWLMAPAPHESAPPTSRLPGVRTEFLATLSDIASEDADTLRHRIHGTRSLRELWHLRAEVYRVVGVAHSEWQAEQRVALLNRHFPTRAPRSQFSTTLQ
jgi:hypothetical protein